MTGGLETQCGKCVAAQSELDSCDPSPGTVDDTACAAMCVPGSHLARADFRAECEVECRLDAAYDGCEIPPTCVADCVAMTTGLETQCGKCVAAQSELDSCDPSPGTVDDTACAAMCVPGSHLARADFRAECEAECRLDAAYDGCEIPPTCVSDCVAMTNGLETQCGKCVAAQSELDSCDPSPGTVDSEACNSVCNR